MKKLLLPLLALAALALPARAALPRPTAAAFDYGTKLTVAGYTNANGTARSTTLQNFPVLVRIAANSPTGFSYSHMQNANAADRDDIDLAFVDMEGNGLPFEIDTWDASGDSLVWVRLPVMTNGTEFVMCWGSASSGKAVCNDNPWSDYAGVWHMGETGSGAITIYDSTENDLDGTADSASTTATGRIGGARFITNNKNKGKHGITIDLQGASNAGKMAVVNALTPQFSASLWFRHTGDKPQWNVLLTRRFIEATTSWGLQFDLEAVYTPLRVFGGSVPPDLGAGPNGQNITSKAELPGVAKGDWHKLDVVWKSDVSYVVYLDGTQTGTGTLDAGFPARNGTMENLCIGGAPNSSDKTSSRGFYGDMDEVRLGTFAPSEDWVAADYATQTNPSFLTAGTAEPYASASGDDPLANLSVDPVQYTNATAKVLVNSLGAGASSATVHVEFAENAAFASPLVKSADVPVGGSGVVEVPATGLSYGTTYYVRGSVANNQNNSTMLGPVVFTTLTPGVLVGAGTFVSPGFSKIDVGAWPYAFGKGATTATAQLEVSENADFSTFVAGPATALSVESETPISVSGLSPDTAYNLRIRYRNDMGFETVVSIPGTTTLGAPFLANGIGWTFDGDTVDFSFGVTEVSDGATVSAVLTYDEVEVGTRTCTAADTLSWTGVAAASGAANATLVVTATLPDDGGTFTKTWTASVVPGGSSIVVNDVSTYASAVGALWMRPGDMAVLPERTGDASYQVLNTRFASVDGNTLTALEPGIVGVRCVDPTGVATVMGVIVLPDAIGDGSVYILDETKLSNPSWTKASCWKKVGSDSNDSYPRNTNDIAILPFYTKSDDQAIRHTEDIALGGLYAGMIRPGVSVNCILERSGTPRRTLTFRRTDGEPVRIQVCPNSEGSFQSYLTLGGSADIDVVWASDTVIDGGSSEVDLNGPRGRFKIHNTASATTCSCTNTLKKVTLTIRGLPGLNITANTCTDVLHGAWRGSGVIVKKGMGGIAFTDDFSGFSGTIRELSGPNLGDIAAPAAGVLMRAAGASNVTAHVYGYAAFSRSNGSMSQASYNGLSVGTLGTGGAAVTPDKGAQGPAKGLCLHGGTYRANNISKTGWGVGGKDEKTFDVLSVGAGLNSFSIQNGAGNASGNPINAITVKSLRQTDLGTLAIHDPSCSKPPSQSSTNAIVRILDWTNHVVGATGDNQISAVYPIVPWILVNRDDNFNGANFASFDATGRIVQPQKWTNTEIDAVAGEDSNAYVSGKSINRNATTKPNIVVQSLYLNDSGKTRALGAGRTLTVTSGGLVLYASGSAIGLADSPNANGSLVLGDETHPAYVWTRENGVAPNEIWAATTAAGGFVKSWTGNLVLGGPQTNIAVEIAVNGGSLQLGNATKDCALAEGLPIRVCAGATLKLPYEGTVAASPLKIDGAAEAFGTIELPVNQSCASLAIRDVFESDDWTALPAGTYGSSESGAEFVRDDLFAGTGMLTVGSPAPRNGNTVISIW